MSSEHATPLRQAESLGHILKQARESKGYSEDDVADALRLEKSVILRMEQDAYLAQEVSVFVRGYFRAYAKHVEIPTQQVDNYFLEKGLLNIPKKVSPAKFDFTLPSNSRRSLHLTTFFIVASVIILIVGWIYWQRSDVNNSLLPAVSSNEPSLQPTAQQAQMAQTQTPPPAQTAQAAVYNAAQPVVLEQAPATSTANTAAAPSPTVTAASAPTATPQSNSTQTATSATNNNQTSSPTQLAMIASQPIGQ